MAKHKNSLGRLSPSVTHTDNCRTTWIRNRKEMLSTYKFVYMFILLHADTMGPHWVKTSLIAKLGAELTITHTH